MPPEEMETDSEDGDADPEQRLNPVEKLSYIRTALALSLRTSDEFVNQNIEQNILEIQGLLLMNNEIFDRCWESRTCNRFVRWSYDMVETYTDDSSIQFITYPEHSKQNFDYSLLWKIPAEIEDIFPLRQKYSGCKIVDFQALFEKSLILHDDVLGPFLAKLKVHLMSIQLCLGEIDAWLMEPMHNIKYLESTFGIKIEALDNTDKNLERQCACQPGTHSDSLLCLRCNEPLKDHNDKKECPGQDPKYYMTHFWCKKFLLLKKCTNNLPGKVRMKFSLSKESDKQKLEKLLELVEIA